MPVSIKVMLWSVAACFCFWTVRDVLLDSVWGLCSMRYHSTAIGLLDLATAALGARVPYNRRQSSYGTPTVTVKNGTIAGVHSSTYNEDYFLGIPYAQ